MAIGHQSFYQTQLTSSISDTDLVIPVDNPPIPSEGFLVIEGTVEAKREIIYYTSKDGTSVTCPSGAGNGRGYDGTTAVSHLQGAAVVMAPVGAMFDQLGDITVNSITIGGTPSAEGWSPLGATPNTVTANGNKSYDLVFNGTDLTDTITEGMRVRTARTVAAPIQCTDLESASSQYYSKTSPNKLTFTDEFTVMAWIKLESYGTNGVMARRSGDVEGWSLYINSSGQVVLDGLRIASNNRSLVSYQSVPLAKWVHVAATLDMSAGTGTVYIDGVLVPSVVNTTGTATALVQGTTALVVGALRSDGTSPFDGKIAQAAVFSDDLAAATIRSYMNQGLTGSETSLASAYSFSNSITDLNTTTPNDLTANGSAVATATDSPFGNSGVSTTIDYGIVMAKSFSTNTTLTVQVPEGCTIPTSGGVASMDYSTQAVPYGFPRDKGRWSLYCKIRSALTNTSSATYVAFSGNAISLTVPSGSWKIAFQFNGIYSNTTTTITSSISPTSLVGLGVGSYSDLSFRAVSTGAVSYAIAASGQTFRNISTAENWVLYTIGAATTMGIDGSSTINELYAENALL